MSFRAIRPSTNDPMNQSSESTSSDQVIRTPQESTSSSSGAASKRRRVPESVTRNACLNCKKARAKCNGQKPCGRCVARSETSPCVYEIHVKHAKEELVKQIKGLEAKDLATRHILRALTAEKNVPEILRRLKHGDSYDNIADWLTVSEGVDVTSPALSNHSVAYSSDQDMEGATTTEGHHWTNVVGDSSVLDHLFQLYFAWVHPVNTLFSEGHFVNSLRSKNNIYCSSVLVNAICAMACHLNEDADLDESEEFSRRFSDAVRAELDPHDGNLTTVQAFAVMFLVDCARGNSLKASSYLRVATSLLLKVHPIEDESFQRVYRDTARGLFSLNGEWAQLTYQIPRHIKPVPPEPADEDSFHLDSAAWYFYRHAKEVDCPHWASLAATATRERAKLTTIVAEVNTLLYTPAGPSIHAQDVLELYAKYRNWYDALPRVIREFEENSGGGPALPHILSLLFFYSSSIVHLLRPLLYSSDLLHTGIDEVVWTHAQTGLSLIENHYLPRYTARYQPICQMFSMLHLCDVIARFFPEKRDTMAMDGTRAISLGIETLEQSRRGFPIAAAFQELLRRTAIECSVPLPTSILALIQPGASSSSGPSGPSGPAASSSSPYRLDDFLDACTWPSYVQPCEEILECLSDDFVREWSARAPGMGFQRTEQGARRLRRNDVEERAAQNLMQISSLLNS